MEERQSIQQISAADAVHSTFLLGSASLQQSRNGPYWRLELRDASGAMEAKIWSPLSTQVTELAPGMLVEVDGHAGIFREQIQLTVEALRVLEPEELAAVDWSAFLPCAARPPQEMLEELEEICRRELRHAPWRKLALSVLRQKEIRAALLTAPAAKAIHHAYRGGLLEHTLSVVKLVLYFSDHYPQLDRQTLLVGALFHDMGKIWEFTGGPVNEYSDDGRLLGHMELALEKLSPFLAASGLEAELIRHVKHLILSHHGTPEFGAARLPQTAEALALHYADNLDAKMAQCHALFTELPDAGGGAWTPYQPSLGRSLYRSVHTPEDPGAAPVQLRRKKSREKQKQSLLLPF